MFCFSTFFPLFLNEDSFATFLTSTIEQLKKMNATLMAYTSQMLHVVSTTKVPTEAATTTDVNK